MDWRTLATQRAVASSPKLVGSGAGVDDPAMCFVAPSQPMVDVIRTKSTKRVASLAI